MNHGNMKILLTDDHAVVRHGLKQILADEFKKATFGEARNAQEALNRVWGEHWDVVVLDITMPGRNEQDSQNSEKNFDSSVNSVHHWTALPKATETRSVDPVAEQLGLLLDQ